MFRIENRAFFVFGFAKSDMDNIDEELERTFRKMAKEVLTVSDTHLAELIAARKFLEIGSDEEVSK